MKKMSDRLDNGLDDFENDTSWKILLMNFKETKKSVKGFGIGSSLKDKIGGMLIKDKP